MYVKKELREKLDYYKNFKWGCTKEQLIDFLKQAFIYGHFAIKNDKDTYQFTDGTILETKKRYKIGDLIFNENTQEYYMLQRKNYNPTDPFYEESRGTVIFVEIINNEVFKWSFYFTRHLDTLKKEYVYYVSEHPFYLETMNKEEVSTTTFRMSYGLYANQSGFVYTGKSEWRIPTKSCNFDWKGYVLLDDSFKQLNLRNGYDYIDPCKTDSISLQDYFRYSIFDDRYEKISKMGLFQLINKSLVFDFEGKSFKQITGLDKTYANTMKHVMYNSNIHDLVKQFNLNKEMIYKLMYSTFLSHGFYVLIYINENYIIKNNLIYKILNYFLTNRIDVDIYRDYFKWLVDLGYPGLKENLFPKPKDLKILHDKLEKEYAEKQDIIFNQKIKTVSDQLKQYHFESNKFIIEPFISQVELIEESQKLNHCIRTYAKQYAEKQTELYKIRLKNNKDEPYYSLEFKNGIVLQCRTLNNKSATPEIVKFYEKWVKEIRLKEEEND